MSCLLVVLTLASILQLLPPSTIIAIKHGENLKESKEKDREEWNAFRVFHTGQVEEMKFHVVEEIPAAALGWGSTDPLPSPDGRYITFTHRRNLWVWDSQTSKTTQLTTVGADSNRRFKGVLVLTADWSLDSKEILYYVSEDIGGEDPPFPSAVRRTVDFGFHIYNLEARQSRKMNIPGTNLDDAYPTRLTYDAWLPDGDVIGHNDDGLTLIDPRSGAHRIIASGKGFGQIAISRAGNFLVAVIAPLPASNATSQVVKVNIKTGEVTPLSSEGHFAEFQDPSFSPSAKHMCYLHVVPQRDAGGRILSEQTNVVCDDKPIVQIRGQRLPRLRWIDDTRAAIVNGSTVVILDVSTSSEIGHAELLAH